MRWKRSSAPASTCKSQLAISNRAHVIFPFHRIVEKMSEGRQDRVPIGTTSRGIGPCYEDKIGRRGYSHRGPVRAREFLRHVRALAEDKQLLAQTFNIHETIDYEKIRDQYLQFADRIRPMVCDTAQLLHDAMQAGKRVLFEGAQGSMLDVDHGTYPFVTSSSATAGGACTGAGVPPTRIHGVIGVSKAYTTRVGSGPFPTELDGEEGERIRQAGNEYGAVTGRPRRCGWFDVPLLRYTAMINGFTSLVITKLDVLDQFDEILVCTAYRGTKTMPATFRESRSRRAGLRESARLEVGDPRPHALRGSAAARAITWRLPGRGSERAGRPAGDPARHHPRGRRARSACPA